MGKSFEQMTVVELKDRLRKKNLPVSGNKNELIERLRGKKTDSIPNIMLLTKNCTYRSAIKLRIVSKYGQALMLLDKSYQNIKKQVVATKGRKENHHLIVGTKKSGLMFANHKEEDMHHVDDHNLR